MTLQRRDLLLVVTLAAAAATPAFGQTMPSMAAPANSGKESAAFSPDFSGMWVHGSIPGFEPLASGPTSLVNRSRRSVAQLIRDLANEWQGPGEPPSENVSNLLELVGDYTNPILQPWAAEVVKKFGEISTAGVTFPNPANQCWPEPVPFIFKHNQMLMIQQPDTITMI